MPSTDSLRRQLSRWLFILFTLAGSSAVASETCHYTYSVWNAQNRQTSRSLRVEKRRSELTSSERGPFGCTPCEEDQVHIKLSNGIRYQLCKKVAGPVTDALEEALKQGATINKVVGYRPSMSRGPLNPSGERTRLSNHAFGVAVDINPNHNGLYGSCLVWGPKCKLLKGGPWNPDVPLSLQPGHPVLTALLKSGLRWGGSIKGNQKDMMHFSPSGY